MVEGESMPERKVWTIDGVVREGIVYGPSVTLSNGASVVFAFHGHGGTAEDAARLFDFQTQWPEAVVVYLQGIHRRGRWGDPEGKQSGWQFAVDAKDDRDLRFFDAVLESVRKEYRVDDKRIFAMGHSNGGYFTYLLWATRGDVLAAVAPVAASIDPEILARLKPKPVLHIAGEKDTGVKFVWQQESIEMLRRLNECGEGVAWNGEKYCTLYPSEKRTPVVAFVHPGGHEYPRGATGAVVSFFKDTK